jgi:hypothetical protein
MHNNHVKNCHIIVVSFMRYCDLYFMCISHFLICVIFLFLSFHQCSILIFQLSAITAISAVMFHYMKYFPLSICATWAHHIPFYLSTWHGIDLQLQVLPTPGKDSSSGADHIWILACILTLPWPAGHICPTYKESFQVHWDNSIQLFLHAGVYLEVSLFRWTMLCSIAHIIICTRLFHRKMHSAWFNRIEILQGRC